MKLLKLYSFQLGEIIVNRRESLSREFSGCGFAFLFVLLLSGCGLKAYVPENYVRNETTDISRLADIEKIALLDVPVPGQIFLGGPVSDVTGFFFR